VSTTALANLLSTPAPDMSAAQVKNLKKEIERGSGGILSNEKEQGPFMFYLLGNDYLQVSEQCGWPINTILLTAIKNQWYEKKQLLALNESKDAARHVFKSAIDSMLATTTAVIMRQMQQIMRGEMEAADCKYIPKDVYGLEKFMSVVNHLHKFTDSDKDKGNVQNVNVNIANLPAAQAEEFRKLPPPLTVEEYNSISREDRLKMLMPNLKKD
jgi:hypothetical protein